MKNTKIVSTILSIVIILIMSGCLGRNRQTPPEQIPSGSETPTPAQEFTLGPGDYDFSLQVGGSTRKYLLHIPATYEKSKPAPLVLAFHGAMGTAEIMAKHYGWIPKSDKEGFIVAFPNGASRLSSGEFATWNAGNCCGYALESQSDDVGFVRAVIEDIKGKVNIDKIFATGMSNGGMFSYRLACEMSDTLTAIAAVSGTDNYDGCNPAKPISIMHIHGLQDDHVLFYGGCGPACVAKSEPEFVSVPDTISKWVQRDNCDNSPQTTVVNENAYYDLYAHCEGGVQVKLYVVKDGGHSWPGAEKSSNSLEKSAPSQAISATDEIWNFFNEVSTKTQ